MGTEAAALVYQSTNRLNGKRYIGFTTQGRAQRERDHRRHAEAGGGFLLHAAIRKYGFENIEFETLAEFEDKDLAKVYEWEMIAKHKPEYNIALGGDGGVSPSMARKISAANKGRPSPFKGVKWTEEAKQRMRDAKRGQPGPWAGKKRSPETAAKISASLTGKPSPHRGRTFSPEIRERMAVAARKRPLRAYSEEHKATLRASMFKAHASIRIAVQCLNDGRVFDSMRAADIFYGLAKNTVSKALSNPRRRANGLRFACVAPEA